MIISVRPLDDKGPHDRRCASCYNDSMATDLATYSQDGGNTKGFTIVALCPEHARVAYGDLAAEQRKVKA